ncbi:adenine deaminase [Paenibacillus sp. UMB4589-SE434]|uniref:adenine deaminase n=1 Tax=Paenibacillus sp. UMB4589-SE434 TaxID=3046314 RepID=UPI002551766E|nr:adenine deaminase [Paenibacillus sp. UMB4589-SE434]MDK8181453.1 adenine deaminase [Paenibacillus sp. UMB4589-SE434]
MTVNQQQVQHLILSASKQKPADLVIKNGRIIDVFNLEVITGDVAITDGRIVGIGRYEGKQEIDAQGRYIAPSFIDTHVHIESSMVTPPEFARVVLPHGITTVVTDPHEIANVSGADGIQYMLDASEGLPLDVRVMLPSCVPATQFENAGAVLTADKLRPFYAHPRVLGLAEVMDYPSVRQGDEDMTQKLTDALQHSGYLDGHGAGLDDDAVNVYRAAGIRTDHECVRAEEAKSRLSRGMYVMLREGSVAKDVQALAPVVTAHNARRCVFCTDDKHLDELITEGSVDYNVRLAIQCGIDPLTAIQMASLNAAECFGFMTKGAVAPGFDADLLLLDDLEQIKIHQVYRFGQLVAQEGQYVGPMLEIVAPPDNLLRTVHIQQINEQHLHMPLDGHHNCHIIGISPNSLITRHLIEEVDAVGGCFQPSTVNDQLKIAVVERHHDTGNIGLGIVKGFALTSGAIASTVAHDSHNLVVAGTNDRDMLLAIETLHRSGGGLAVIKEGQVLASLNLPLAGLISTARYEDVVKQLEMLHQALDQVNASKAFHPFVTLSFLCLPVIPELKLTDMGLFDFQSFRHISITQN